ncbi:MAG: SIS domain-containing protein [Myxococcota bacterium]
MCGLMGVIAKASQTLPPLDPRLLVEQVRGVQLQDLAGLSPQLSTLEDGVQRQFDFNSVFAALHEPSRADSLEQLGHSLEGLIARLETETSRPHPVETLERYSAAALQARDLAWRIQQDLIPNLQKVQNLSGGQLPPQWTRAFALWKLNTMLNGIDRLEVRGRDSAGFSLQLYFTQPGTLDTFLSEPERAALFHSRSQHPDFINLCVRRVPASEEGYESLLFSYKVALEIGEMGENVTTLRQHIRQDRLLQEGLEQAGVLLSSLAHTRWASNGVISEPNCHPIDNRCTVSTTGHLLESGHSITAALNGDIDNYQHLKERLEQELGRGISASITTDAKIIPLWIDRNLSLGMGFEEAFRAAVSEFQGSMAIGVQTSLAPGKLFLAQRGSGQSVYIGVAPHGYLFASELYGLVEETRKYLRLDGEKERIPGDASTAGQLAVLDEGWQSEGRPSFRLSYYDGTPVDAEKMIRKAEITTRDINRAGYPHFMLKEITESVQSVRKTLRGKYTVGEAGVRFAFVEELLDPELRHRIQQGKIRRIYCVGQGTAAVAGNGIAALMSQLLAEAPVEIIATKATELSGFYLRNRMEDTLVVAVSQSGTTTDTNRTVDMVKERGAKVLAIVNRRNSDLVYKADAVLYTSDGRDVEMSVASTKAFYAQVTAGYLLALSLGQLYGTLTDHALREALSALEQLPVLIGKILQDHGPIQALAEQFAVRHRYWAVVGNGANRVAADEIRIKLSELCYKAIACDFTEDKKHIDLSSEPLILVCATGMGSSNLSDVVKEVAIFKAHKAKPLVITTEGETRFDPYAAGILHVPRGAGALSFVLTTVVGHLWGYYAARALDGQAQHLRRLRARSVAIFERLRQQSGATAYEPLTAALRAELMPEIRQLEGWLSTGALDSGLPGASAVRLVLMLHAVTGRIGLDDVVLELGAAGPVGGAQLFEAYLTALSGAINDLTRPIDAIKHQAKTVTVGISRNATPTGVLFESLEGLGIPVEAILPSHAESLEALSPLVERVTGCVEYGLEQLNEAGEPTLATRIRVRHKTGIVAQVRSRADEGASLIGSKWFITLEKRIFAGVGSSDGKRIIMFPLLKSGRMNGLLLLHVQFDEGAGLDARLQAVRAYRNRYERLRGWVTENSLDWQDELLLQLPVAQLFEGSNEVVMNAVRAS